MPDVDPPPLQNMIMNPAVTVYKHRQTDPAETWLVRHELGLVPTIVRCATDSGLIEEHPNLGNGVTVTLTFSTPQTGVCYVYCVDTSFAAMQFVYYNGSMVEQVYDVLLSTQAANTALRNVSLGMPLSTGPERLEELTK